MAGTLIGVLLLIVSIAITLILITALSRASASFNPSIQDVRNLVAALEDLALPMGSFLSEFLHPWGPNEGYDDLSSSESSLSATSAPGSSITEHDGGSVPSKPMSDDCGVEPYASIHGGSNPEAKFTLVVSPPGDKELAASVKSPQTAQQTSDADLNTITLPSLITATGESGQRSDFKDITDEPSIDSPEDQQEGDSTAAAEEVSSAIQATEQQDEDSSPATEKVPEEVPTESQEFEKAIRNLVDPDGISGSTLGDLVELVAKDMTRRTEAEGKLESETVRHNRAEEDLRTEAEEKLESETARHNRAEEDLRTEAEEKLESETARHNRAEEDLRHDWIDKRETFDRIIAGQNEAAEDTLVEYGRLTTEQSTLVYENAQIKEQLCDLKRKYKVDMKLAREEKELAEDAQRTALADVDGQLEAEREKHASEKSAAEDKHTQEINSQICLKRMVSDSLAKAQNSLNSAVKQHQVALKGKDQTIRELRAELIRVEPAVAAAEERAASDKSALEEQLKNQLQKKDGEIGSLTDQLRAAKYEAKSLSQSSKTWKSKAESQEQMNQWLSEQHKKEKTEIREQRDHVVGNLKHDIAGLRKSITDSEAEIGRLNGRITELESGEEVQKLKSQLQKLKKQLKDSKQKLQNDEQEVEKLQNDVKAQEGKLSEEAKRASNEKDALQKQLEDALRVSEEGLNRKIQEFEQQNNALSRQIEAAQSAEQTLRTDMQRLEEEKRQTATEYEVAVRQKNEELGLLQQTIQQQVGQTAAEYVTAVKQKDEEIGLLKQAIQQQAEQRQRTTEHETTVREKDEEIHRLRQAVQQQDERRQAAMEHERTVREKDEEIQRLQQAVQRQDERRQTAVVHETNMREKVEEISRLKNEVQTARNAANARSKENEREQAKVAVEEAAKDATEDARPTFQSTEIQFAREYRKPKSVKRPGKPGSGILPSKSSTGGQMGTAPGQSDHTHGLPAHHNGSHLSSVNQDVQPQSQATMPPAQLPRDTQSQPEKPANGNDTQLKAQPKRDHRRPFMELLASVSPTPVIQVHPVSTPEPVANNQSPSPGLLGNKLEPVIPGRQIRNIRARGRQLAHKASAAESKDDSDKQLPKKPVGWTQDLTDAVEEMFDEDTTYIEHVVMLIHSFVTEDPQELTDWVKKLQSDFQAESDQRKLRIKDV